MKKACKTFLALILCVTMVLPIANPALAFTHGQVVEDDGTEDYPSVIFDEESNFVYPAAGTVVNEDENEPLPSGQYNQTDTEYNGVPDNFVKENADEVLTNEYGEEVGLFTIGEDGGITRQKKRTRMRCAWLFYREITPQGRACGWIAGGRE